MGLFVPRANDAITPHLHLGPNTRRASGPLGARFFLTLSRSEVCSETNVFCLHEGLCAISFSQKLASWFPRFDISIAAITVGHRISRSICLIRINPPLAAFSFRGGFRCLAISFTSNVVERRCSTVKASNSPVSRKLSRKRSDGGGRLRRAML